MMFLPASEYLYWYKTSFTEFWSGSDRVNLIYWEHIFILIILFNVLLFLAYWGGVSTKLTISWKEILKYISHIVCNRSFAIIFSVQFSYITSVLLHSNQVFLQTTMLHIRDIHRSLCTILLYILKCWFHGTLFCNIFRYLEYIPAF